MARGRPRRPPRSTLVPVNLRSSQADTRGGFNYTPTTKFVRIKCRKAENQSGVAIGLMGARTTCRGHYVPPPPSISTSISSILLSSIHPPRIRNAPPVSTDTYSRAKCISQGKEKENAVQFLPPENKESIGLTIHVRSHDPFFILFLLFFPFIVSSLRIRMEESLDRKKKRKRFPLSAIFPLP